MIHEAGHANEPFEYAKWEGRSSAGHARFELVRLKVLNALKEANTELNIGLNNYDLEVLSYAGAEMSWFFGKFIEDQAKLNNTTIEQEMDKYNKRKKELFKIKINITK